jgi:hypothetical protein
MDSENIRSFTLPCTEKIVENKNYIDAVHQVLFWY